jgi:peptidoglycan-associated lipoprotein
MTFQKNWSRIGLMFVLLGTLLIMSCRKPVATATPPPPAPAPPPAPTPTITLRANPTTIERGRAVTLQWETTNAGTVRIDPNIGDVSTTGSRDVSPTSSVTYTAIATGPGGTAQDIARITVNAPPPPPEASAPIRNAPSPSVDELFRGNVQTIYFDYDKSDIRPDQVPRLQANANWLRQNPNFRFTIEGHCDEKGSQEYNLALGDQRANAVKEFLVTQGIPLSRMSVISHGEEQPVCRDITDDCMQRNRRSEFVLNP